ncbi:MAG: hypothetical protein ACUVQ8_01105 [Nitrososphaeria archaeon]
MNDFKRHLTSVENWANPRLHLSEVIIPYNRDLLNLGGEPAEFLRLLNLSGHTPSA